jgi:hypothetical protein
MDRMVVLRQQEADFDEFTVALKRTLRIEHKSGAVDVEAGQAVHATRYEWVRDSTPAESGMDCIAVCVHPYARATLHRDY